MSSFWANIFRRKTEPVDLSALLRKIFIFEDLTGRELRHVLRILYRLEYKAGDIIFRQGDPGLGMYIVTQGRVAILREEPQQVLVELGKGDFFGEIALLNEIPRTATARAETSCFLLGFFQPDLYDLMARHPHAGVKILNAVAQATGRRLVAVNEEMESLRLEVEELRGTATDEARETHAA